MDTKLRQNDRLLIINKNDIQNLKYFAKVLDVKTDEIKDITITKIQIIWTSKSCKSKYIFNLKIPVQLQM